METLQNLLAEHPFAQGLEECYLALLTGCASNVRFEAGRVIFREGEEADQFYLVRVVIWRWNCMRPHAVRSRF